MLMWAVWWPMTAAHALTCDEVSRMVATDVPEQVILARLVGSLPDGLPRGTQECFATVMLPPPPPAGANDRKVYLLELHRRFPCDPSVIAAARTYGIGVPSCPELPRSESMHWTADIRASVRAWLRE